MFCKHIRQLTAVILMLMLIASMIPAASGEGETRALTVLFTSDIHSYFEPYKSEIEGVLREHGGAGRLKTLVDQYSNDHTLFVDAGDFSMGTLLQAGYATDAYELRLLGAAGCNVTTFGNHEFDYAGTGVAEMLESALQSGDPLPEIMIPVNLQFSDEMTESQLELYNALEHYGAKRYEIYEVDGMHVGVFGLLGKEASTYVPTSGVEWRNPIEAAKEIVQQIADEADVIICISHSGTNGDGETGEDFDLIKEVPQIDVVVSGHSHTVYHSAITKDGAILGSPGEYLSYLGRMELDVDADGKVSCTDYELIPCDEHVEGDTETETKVARFRDEITNSYLAADGLTYDTVIAHSDFSMMSLSDMYAIRDEYPMGELIADAYKYESERNGIDDIDVAMVGLGTIRGSISEGDLTVANAFELCSLGVGSDGSAGHAIISAYLYGSELKLLTELDAMVGGFMANVRMSYSGLNYTWVPNRMILDRVRNLCIEHADGTTEPVDPSRLYKVAVNLYAANLLDGLLDMSRGIVKIIPKYADGSVMPSSEFSKNALIGADGREIKEWVAVRNYLSSFPEKNGVPNVPDKYREPLGRKTVVEAHGFEGISHPGTSTIVVLVLIGIVILLIIYRIATRKKRKARRMAKRAARAEKRKNRKK